MISVRSSLSKTSFFKIFPPLLKRCSGLKRKLPFGDGLMWIVSLTVEIKLFFKFVRRSVDKAL